MAVAKVRVRSTPSLDKPVRLRVAASMLHHELGGDVRSAMRGPDYLLRLNDAARALSEVIQVFRLDRGGMRPIDAADVASGELLDGGKEGRSEEGSTEEEKERVRRTTRESFGAPQSRCGAFLPCF